MLSDKMFYKQHPDLAAFDNGVPFFSLSENRSVGLDEFIEYGKEAKAKKSKETTISYQDAFRSAALDLRAILEKNGAQFARYYIENVMERDLARRFIHDYGESFYRTSIPERIEAKGPGFILSNIETPYVDASDVCLIFDRFEAFSNGSFMLSKSEGRVGRGCAVHEESVDFNRSPTFLAGLNVYQLDGSPSKIGSPSSVYRISYLYQIAEALRTVAFGLDSAKRPEDAFGTYLLAKLCDIYSY